MKQQQKTEKIHELVKIQFADRVIYSYIATADLIIMAYAKSVFVSIMCDNTVNVFYLSLRLVEISSKSKML
jgi:hypothetical protein